MFILMLILFFILFLCSYYLFKKDLFAPGIIVSFIYLVSGLCALYNYTIWDLNTYHGETVAIILVGLMTFLVVSVLVWMKNKEISFKQVKEELIQDIKNIKKFSLKKFLHKEEFKEKKKKEKMIRIPIYISIFFLLIILLTIVLRVIDIYHVNELLKFNGSFFKMIGNYRSVISYSAKNISYKAPFLLNQLDKIVTALSYICLYITLHNIVFKDKIKQNWFGLLYLVFFAIYTIVSGGRMPLLKLLAASMLYYYVLSNIKYGWNNKEIRKKMIKVLASAFLILILLFPAMHNILGRNRSLKPDYYITMYAGGSLKLLDLYVTKPVHSDFFGKETFYTMHQVLSKLHLESHGDYVKHLEFRTYKKMFLGNVYTPFRRYYADFGILGVIIFTAIFAIFINVFYLLLKKKVSQNDQHKNIYTLCYGIIVYSLFLYSINEEFFAVILSPTYLTYFIIAILAYILYKKTENQHKGKKSFLEKKKEEKHSLKRNIMRVFSANFIYTITSILIGFIVPAILTIEGYADLKTYTLYMTYAGVLHFGFVDGIYLKYGGKEEEKINKNKIKGEHIFLSMIQFLVTILLLFIALLRKDNVLLLMAISVLPANLVSFHKQYYQAVGNFKKYSFIMHGYTIAYALFNLALVFLLKCESYEFYCLTNFICNTTVLIFAEVFFFTKMKGIKATFDKKELKQITKSGFFLMIGNLAAIFLYAIDKWFVKLFFETKDFSYYSFAVSMFNIIIVFLNSVSITFYNIFAKQEIEDQVKKIKTNLIIIGSLASVSYFILAFIVSSFLEKYIPSLSIIAYSFATFPYLFVIKAIFVNLYKSRKKEKRYTNVVMMMVVIASLLNTLAMFIYKSTDTIAMATLISFIIWFVFSFVDFAYLKPTISELFYLAVITPCFIICTHLSSTVLGAVIYIAITLIGMILILKRNPIKLIKEFLE